MARTLNDWETWEGLALAVYDLGRIAGVRVSTYLDPVRDVMCCKVAGQAVNITRKELEERNFVGLYDALKAEMERAGLQDPERFLLRQQQPPPYPTATQLAMQAELQRQYALTQQAIADNQYRKAFGGMFNPAYQMPVEVAVAAPAKPAPATWREPRATPELDLGEISAVAAETATEASATAPDLILEGEHDGTGKKAAS
jgi:hypothetical protein